MSTTPPTKLSASELEHYRSKGWLVVEGVFDSAEVDAIARIALAVGEAELDGDRPSHGIDRSSAGDVAPRKVDRPFLKHRELREFVLDPRLVALVSELLGNRHPLLLVDQIFLKPPGFGSAKPYHQDNFYFRLAPADHVVTAWIALDDVDPSNGCLRYIDGSHRGGVLRHGDVPGEPHNSTPPAALVDLSKESLAPLGRGGVVFHHSETLHASGRNESARWRRAYATHWVTDEVTCETTTLDDAYFLREDYPG